MIKLGVLIFISALCFVKADNVPVLIFQKNSNQIDNSVTIGHSLASDDFTKHLMTLNKPVEVILVDEISGQDVQKYLKKESIVYLKNLEYLPSVESAYPTLKSFLDKNQMKSNIEDFKMDLEGAFKTFKSKQTTEEIVILTGLKFEDEVHKISKRAAEKIEKKETKETKITDVFGKQCAASFGTVYLEDYNDKVMNRVVLKVDKSDFDCSDSSSTLSLKVTSDKKLFGSQVTDLKLIFGQASNKQYWQISSNSSIKTASESLGIIYMGAPYSMDTPNKFSFVCTRTYFKVFNASVSTLPLVKVSLYIENLQIQPNNVEMNGTDVSYGKVNYCQGFFTSGIWMTIMTSLILILILAMGVTFLCNINTMDRFDDPKGKPLNIAIEK